MLNRYIVYFFFAMVMQIIVFTTVTMTQGLVYCNPEDVTSDWTIGTWLGKEYRLHPSLDYLGPSHIFE